MELTPEVIQAVQEHLTKEGRVIRTKEEDATFVQNQIDTVFGQRNKQLEDTVLETLGVKKETDEKWYDHFKRAVGTTKQQIEAMKAKIAEYEGKGVNGEQLAKEYKAQLEALQATYAKEKETLSTQLNELKTGMFKNKVESLFEGSLSKMRTKFKNDTPFIEDVIENRKKKFFEEISAKEFEGNILWQKEGKTITSKKDGRPAAIDEVMDEYYKDLFNDGKKGAGAGSGKGDGGSGEGGADVGERPESIKTQVQLHDWLTKEKKLNPSSKEFAATFDKLKAGLKLR